jgi:hypothetical protein
VNDITVETGGLAGGGQKVTVREVLLGGEYEGDVKLAVS